MNKTLTLYILASLFFVAGAFAGETGPALAQLGDLYAGGETGPLIDPGFSLPDPSPSSPSWESPWTPGGQAGGSTEDCFLQDGMEICIEPNWPDCAANGNVEPCIDHVQQPLCPDYASPAWLSFSGSSRRHRGCFYPSVYYPEAADKALLLRAEEKGLSVLLRGRKVVFAPGTGEKSSSRGYFTGLSAETSWQEFLENDPCHGLMACYNQTNTELLQELLNNTSGNPYALYAADTVSVGQPAAAGR